MKKKYWKRFLLFVGLLSLVAITAGCSPVAGPNNPPTSGPYGWIYKVLAIPFQNLILYTSRTIGGPNGYAWGIIIISFIVRLILLPLGLMQQLKATTQQEKMKLIQPQVNLIQKYQKQAKTQAQQTEISQLMMKVYSKNNIKLTGGMGCLPLILQFPVFIAIYQAVQFSPKIAVAKFWGVPLAKPSLAIAIVATLFYVLQSWMSTKSLPANQKKQMQMMTFMSPAMTFFISMASSAALALYFLVGGVIIVIQQIISDYVLTPRIKRQIDATLKDNPIKTVVTEDTLKEIIAGQPATTKQTEVQENEIKQHNINRQRNAGKQQHHDDK